MFDNGVVGFFDPLAGGTGGQQFISRPFDQVGTQFNYIIAPLWTDLISYSGVHRVEGTSQYQLYTWENVSPFGRPDLLNTFELEIRPDGFIGVDYLMINFDESLAGRNISIGTVGDVRYQEIDQIGFFNQFPITHLESWEANTADLCFFDTLSDPSCPGYFELQCSMYPLYDSGCDGFASAFYDLQCALDPLYDSGCFGFAEAFYDQQCSLDPLYDVGCDGHAEAFYDQQCSLDPLYDSGCVGHEQAFFEQQCSLNPLYDSGCTGYEQAFYEQQCSLNPLYDSGCAGYEQAFFEQQVEDSCSANANNPLCDDYEPQTVVEENPAEIQIVSDPIVQRAISSPPSRREESTEEEEVVEEEEVTQEEARERRIAQIRNSLREKSPEEIEQEALMNEIANVPGFDVYQSSILQDAPFYAPKEIYANQIPVDNRNAMRLLRGTNDVRYREMVDQQFR